MSTYLTGTVAVATVRGMPGVRVMRHSSHGWFSGDLIGGEPGRFGEWRTHGDSDVTDVRPLVVLDLGAVDGSDLVRVLREEYDDWEFLADQIEAQTRPSITEPTGLGAVVEDRRGRRWVKAITDGGPPKWCRADADPITPIDRFAVWSAIDAVEVLTEGVES